MQIIDEKKYLAEIGNIRAKIRTGNEQRLKEAECSLQALEEIRPYRLVFLFAQAELMLKKGISNKKIRDFLMCIDCDFYPHKELVEWIQLVKKTYPLDDVLGHEQCNFLLTVYKSEETVQKFYVPFEELCKPILGGEISLDSLKYLADQYYITKNPIMYFILMIAWCKSGSKMDEYKSYIRRDVYMLPNMGYFIKIFSDGKKHTFIIIDDEQNENKDTHILAAVLNYMGYEVFFVEQGISYNVTEKVDILTTIPISLNNIEERNGIYYVKPIILLNDGQIAESNRSYLISSITEKKADKNLAFIFCADKIMDEVHSQKDLAKYIQRLSSRTSVLFASKMAVAWTGDYLSYVSFLYDFNAHEKLDRPSKYEFSIVIPARNSARTLRYTLQTCLEQKFEGEYEIVLSDNSSVGKNEIYELYCELNDPHINYYKPPRELPLEKNFEFAFLQAQGEFIFSIGSDDGIFPWTLSVLQGILANTLDTNIIGWFRGFYAWPGFNGGQENMLRIPCNCKKNEIKLNKVSTKAFLKEIISNPDNKIYLMPSFYINSGFRRNYIKQILQKTGRLWDGCSQDIYIGVVNLAINEEFIYADYPLSIAGMTGNSVGAGGEITRLDLMAITNNLDQYNKDYNFRGYTFNQMEYLVPLYWGPCETLFFYELLRLVGIGCLPESYVEEICWQDFYRWVAHILPLKDPLYELKINYLRYSAQQLGTEMADFVEKEICIPSMKPKRVKMDIPPATRWYQVGFGMDADLILDASDFSVQDVYGAGKLFAKITGL